MSIIAEVIANEIQTETPAARKSNGAFIAKTPLNTNNLTVNCRECNNPLEWLQKPDGGVVFPSRMVCWNPKCSRAEQKKGVCPTA